MPFRHLFVHENRMLAHEEGRSGAEQSSGINVLGPPLSFHLLSFAIEQEDHMSDKASQETLHRQFLPFINSLVIT